MKEAITDILSVLCTLLDPLIKASKRERITLALARLERQAGLLDENLESENFVRVHLITAMGALQFKQVPGLTIEQQIECAVGPLEDALAKIDLKLYWEWKETESIFWKIH